MSHEEYFQEHQEFIDSKGRNDNKRVIVTLEKTDGSECQLRIIPFETPLAKKWLKEVERITSKQYKIENPDRVYHLSDELLDDVVDRLHEDIRIINEYQHFFDYDYVRPLTRARFNYLHHQFEKLVGPDGIGTEYYDNAPKYVKDAIQDLNITIHKLESYDAGPRIVVTFNSGEYIDRYPLAEEDYEEFSLLIPAGTVVLNYCHAGKRIMDYLLDKDPYATNNVLPQNKWSADFHILFDGYDARNQAERVWIENEAHLNELGFTKGDPHNAIHDAPLGQLEGNLSEILDEIRGSVLIKKVEVVDI